MIMLKDLRTEGLFVWYDYVMDEPHVFQINEIKKLDYGFFEKIALAGDSLNYTFSDPADQKEVQVEVAVKMHKKIEALLVTIDFTSDTRKGIHVSEIVETYLLRKDNSWHDSSYDGSEFTE